MQRVLLLVLFLGFDWCFCQTTNINGVINEYTPVTAFSGCNSLVVGSSSGFSPGDKVLIIQMKGAEIDTSNTSTFGTINTYNDVGNYEYNFIQSIVGNTIYLQFVLLRTYNLNQKVQLISVPVYQNAFVNSTLTCMQWNGTVGGILAFDVTDTLSLNSDIDVSAMGFAGGIPSNNYYVCTYTNYYCTQNSGEGGQKGESILYYSTTNECGRGSYATGGGGGNNTNTGGGGGANGGNGGSGGKQYYPCGSQILGGIGGNAPAYSNVQNKIFLGGGGGGGHQNDSQGGNGGNGGGLVVISSNYLAGNNYKIISNGENGNDSWGDGAGGGGAGGTILLNVQNVVSAVTIEAKGGKGGDNTNTTVCHGSGGAGSGGLIWSNQPLPANVTTVLTGGVAGVGNATNCLNSSYGSTDGSAGDTLSGLMLPLSPISISTMVLSLSSTSSCLGPNLGTANVTITGGTSPYSYLWNTSPVQTSSTAVNLSIGMYSVTVTDSTGCSVTDSIAVFTGGNMNLIYSTIPVSCFGNNDGEASVYVMGGLAPFSYLWNTIPVQSTQTINNLNAGNYTVVVTDSAGCQDTATISLAGPSSGVSLSFQNTNCTQSNNITALASGGTPPYTYYWNSNPPQTTQTATNLPPGIYLCTVADYNGCSISDSVTVQISQLPVADAGPDMFFCIGSGGVQLDGTASGGVAPYIYVWAPNNGSLNYTYVEDPTANPDSATTYYFYVIGDNGCISNIDSVVVTPVDIPVVDVGADEWRCPTDVADFITATVLNPVGGYSVQWSPSAGLYCDTCLTTYATPDTTTVYCAVVTSLLTGCSSDPTTLNSLSCLTYTVRPRPVADAGPDFEICQYDSMSTCGIATSAGPQYAFAWSPNYGVNDSTLVCPNFSPPNTTWYTLVVTSNSCPSYADSVLVTVRPTLIGDAGQVRTICADDSVQLDGQYNGMATATGFMWSPAAGLSDSTAQTPMASPASTTWYYFTVFNGLCPSITDSVQVIVNPRPISNAGPDLQLCPEGDSITISGATATAGLPPYTYLWQPSSGLQDATLLNPNLKPDTTTQYTLTVFTGTAPNVCTDIDTMLVTVKPGLNLMMEVDTNTICQGQIAQLTSSAGSGSAVFSWSPILGLSNPNAANTLANPDTTVTYYLTASEHGCSSLDSIHVRVLDTPDAAFTASSTEACGELSVAFLNLTANGSAYEWTFGDGSVSNQTSPLHTYTQPGTYTVTLVALSPGGCADTLIMNSMVSLSDPGMADFHSTPEPPVELSLPNSSTISFYDQSQLAVNWTWDFGDGVSSTDRNPNHTFVKPGVYYVTLTTKTADGCESTLRKGPYTVFTPELFIPNVFTPNNDGIQDGFLTNYGGDEAFLLQIFDRWGTKYFQTTNKNEAWQGTNLNGSKATDGVYFYTLRIGDRNYSGNVTLMR